MTAKYELRCNEKILQIQPLNYTNQINCGYIFIDLPYNIDNISLKVFNDINSSEIKKSY